MTARVLTFFVAVASAALVGCSSVSQSAFTPVSGVSSSAVSGDAANERVLHSFIGGATDGSTPISGLTRIGNLYYGISGGGGTYGKGAIFSISPDGTGFTLLYSFQGKQDGRGSAVDLTAVAGTLYGTTEDGGKTGHGTVFSISPAGTFTTLYSFRGGASDGAKPMAALTNVRGTLFGTTSSGGSANGGACSNCGTVFSISTAGQERVRYFFGATKDDGSEPRSPLVLVGDKLYGTTTLGGIGGAFGNGTIFRLTTGGTETVLYRFKNDADGSCSFDCYLTPLSGVLYGTARTGGKNRIGSVFSITPSGAFKTLYSASPKGNAGGYPSAALANVGGALYGTMSDGPVGKRGTVFSITTGGALTTIYTFAGGNDGAAPSSVLKAFGGKLFGSTARGGGNEDAGTIFSISGIK